MICVTSLPVSSPKSSSPTSGGIRLNLPLEKYRDRTQHQVQVFGMRNQWQENQRAPACATTRALAWEILVEPEPGQVGCHQDEDQQCDDAGFRRHLPSHFGRIRNRRTNRPAMEMATATAKTATNPK